MRWLTAATGLLLLVASPSAHAERQQWRAKASKVSYKLIHKLHEVVGTSSAAEAAALVDATDARVMVRIPVKSFSSGNANRDAHMLEVVEGAAYPFVVLKGHVPTTALPTVGADRKLALEAEIDFHGVKARRKIEIEIAHPDKRKLVATFKFPVSLTKHKIERPSLLFIKVNDDITISGRIELEPK